MRRSRVVFSVITTWCAISQVFAQSAEWAVYENAGTFCSSIVDRYHRVWMGGSRLAVFDGTNWAYYDELNSALPSGSITDIAMDPTGDIWIGVANEHVGGGLVRVNRDLPTVKPDEWSLGFRNRYVYAVAADSAGRIWQASLEPKSGHPGPLMMFDGSTWNESPLLSDTLFYVGDLGVEPDGAVWAVLWNFDEQGTEIAYHYHLFRHSEGTWEYAGPLPLSSGAIRVTMIGADGRSNVWIGTRGNGLLKYDGAGFAVFNTSNSPLPSDAVTALAVEDGSTVWVGTTNGLASFSNAGWHVFDKANSHLPTDEVTTISVDTYGNKWIGTAGGAVAAYREGGLVPVSGDHAAAIPPSDVRLTNHPNPFHEVTVISYSLPFLQHVQLRVYDALGREVAALVDAWQVPGPHDVEFDAGNLPNGRYFVRLVTPGRSQSRPVILLR